MEELKMPLIGDKFPKLAASDEKTAKKRLKEYDCYDWWFCHKKL